MGDTEGITTNLTALGHKKNEYQMRISNSLSSCFPNILTLPSVISGDGLQPFDVCGLTSRLDTDSEEDSVSDNAKKITKNELNVTRTLGLRKRINNEEIKQKFANLENEHKRIHTHIKSLQNNILKKERTVNDLSVENIELNKKYDALMSDIDEKNCNLLEYANINLNLEKQIEKKNAEISQLLSKCEKGDQVQINLMKDIEYYKTELNQLKEKKENPKALEELKKKYNEIKKDNVRLGRKLRELKTSDAESQQKTVSYNVLQKKFDMLQSDVLKLRMENKRLKSKQFTLEQELLLRQKMQVSYKTMETENNELKETIANSQSVNDKMEAELENLKKGKEHLEKEIKIKDDIIKELKEKMYTTSNTLDGLKNNCESTERYAELLLEQVHSYKLKCETLESELEKFRETTSDSADVHALKEEVKKLKVRLGELLLERANLSIRKDLQCQLIQTDQYEEHCANCHFLRQEIEKLGYANLRLHKEKLNLKANFQKLSVKTSKLEIKMEELSADKKLINTSVVERKFPREVAQKDALVQQNLVLSKKLKDVVENYDKLLKDYILLQQDKIPTTYVRSSTIIQELQDHISNSQYAINTIEHKLNEEEGKLHASLYHLRTVKNKLSERKMALK